MKLSISKYFACSMSHRDDDFFELQNNTTTTTTTTIPSHPGYNDRQIGNENHPQNFFEQQSECGQMNDHHHHHSNQESTHMQKKNDEEIIFGIFQQIPLEIIESHIFQYLEFTWLHRVAYSVCKEWMQVIRNSTRSSIRFLFDSQACVESFVAACRHGRFSNVTSFVLGGKLLGQYLPEIVNCDCLNSLKELDLGYSIGLRGGYLIATSVVMKQLEKIDFTGNCIHDEGITVLAKSEHSLNLQSLCARDNGIRGGIIPLSQGNLRNLTFLDLSGNNLFSNDTLKHFCHSNLTNLKTLYLQRCSLTKDLARTFAGAIFPSLTDLDLEQNWLQNEGALSISKGETFKKLIRLNVMQNRINRKTAEIVYCNIVTLIEFHWQ
ncbi:hypothetical protein C9374_003859 [Naegleria lovaniensis]|uniref:F-box domain-containing protein n=1 Tax=Naegleria lovaniensis TaxID=51637 RepID=A0AA88H3S4_NAELO|nr:uncharacterized protein C9374_003859 [Naegleria lovaniensis]KAG2394095.1 hypothetical protein C9374_003859 [Naegleria lovaniensis]